jgi:hypothetical protein
MGQLAISSQLSAIRYQLNPKRIWQDDGFSGCFDGATSRVDAAEC